MNIYVELFTLVTCVTAATYSPTSEGMYGIAVKIRNPTEFQLVKSFKDVPGIEIAKSPVYDNDFFDVLVENDKATFFLTFLEANYMQYQIYTKHFGKPTEPDVRKQYDFTYFPRHQQINEYLRGMASKYGNLVRVIKIGESYEKRSMEGVLISNGGKPKPAIFIDAGIHAREWISSTSALYLVQELVQPSNRYLLDKANFYIFPNINPDGYEYSHTTNRFWRKNRSPNPGSYCIGTDLNRNFDYKWNTSQTNNPCHRTFTGYKAFSEIETKNVANFILSLKGAVRIYLSLHAFGQFLLHPWGYTQEMPPHLEELRKAGVVVSQQMESVRGTKYTVGSSSALLSVAPGGSDDWAMGVAGAYFSYTIELPPLYSSRRTIRDFISIPGEIIPVGREVFQAARVFALIADRLQNIRP